MKLIRHEFDCASSAPIAAGGEPLTQATVRSIEVLRWPHAEQFLIIEPVVERASASFNGWVRPGMVFAYDKPTDVVLRQKFGLPLLTGWDIQLALNPEQDAVVETPMRSTQWWPIIRQNRIQSLATFNFAYCLDWKPTLSGCPRVRIHWSGAPGAQAYIQIQPRCTSAARQFAMLQTQFQNVQDEEKRVVMSAYPGYGNNVVAGEQYAVGFSQQSGGNLDIDVDIAVEEVGQ